MLIELDGTENLLTIEVNWSRMPECHERNVMMTLNAQICPIQWPNLHLRSRFRCLHIRGLFRTYFIKISKTKVRKALQRNHKRKNSISSFRKCGNDFTFSMANFALNMRKAHRACFIDCYLFALLSVLSSFIRHNNRITF